MADDETRRRDEEGGATPADDDEAGRDDRDGQQEPAGADEAHPGDQGGQQAPPGDDPTRQRDAAGAGDAGEGPPDGAAGNDFARGEGEGEGDDEDQDEDGSPKQITLDRYLSQRRPSSKSSWPQLVALGLMLVALVLIIVYKDRCGAAVSGAMGEFDESTEQQQGPTVRFKIAPPSKAADGG